MAEKVAANNIVSTEIVSQERGVSGGTSRVADLGLSIFGVIECGMWELFGFEGTSVRVRDLTRTVSGLRMERVPASESGRYNGETREFDCLPIYITGFGAVADRNALKRTATSADDCNSELRLLPGGASPVPTKAGRKSVEGGRKRVAA
jgi:hypothetical protein